MPKLHRLQENDPHRLQCPVGHSDWKPINGHFWCGHCEQSDWGRDGSFDEVVDAKTGERLDREDVRELEEELLEGGHAPA
jgi:hypothetical protein